MKVLFCEHGMPLAQCNACALIAFCEHRMPASACLLCMQRAAKEAVAAEAKPTDDDPFTVPKGQLTFDAEGAEGGKYHSRKAHWPGGESGVTIGRGYDMKLRKKDSIIADLTAAGVPEADCECLAKGAGKSGAAASSFVKEAEVSKVEITAEAQKALFSTVYEEYEATVRRISNKADTVERYGSVDWDKLHPAILDVAVDMAYRGDYQSDTRRSFQPLMVANDLEGVYTLLSDETVMTEKWKVPKDRYERRKNYLKAALDAEKVKKD